MSYVETGKVFRKFEKEFRGKTLYSFTFDDKDDDRFFRLGEDKSTFDSFGEGDTVKIKVEEDRRGNHIVSKLKVESKGEPAPKGNGGGGRSGSGGGRGGRSGGSNAGDRDAYWTEKARRDVEEIEPRISFYAALERATNQVALLVSAEAVKLPAKTKVAERQDVIDGLVESYAARYFGYAQNVPAFLEGTEHDTGKPEALPDDDDFGDDDADSSQDDDF